MDHTIELFIKCPLDGKGQRNGGLCHEKIGKKIEEKFNVKLIANSETDEVNGYLSIGHNKSEPFKHIIHIHFYDKDENPSNEHLTTFKKSNKIPTLKDCKDCIN